MIWKDLHILNKLAYVVLTVWKTRPFRLEACHRATRREPAGCGRELRSACAARPPTPQTSLVRELARELGRCTALVGGRVAQHDSEDDVPLPPG